MHIMNSSIHLNRSKVAYFVLGLRQIGKMSSIFRNDEGWAGFSIHLKLSSIEAVVVKSIVTIEHL